MPDPGDADLPGFDRRKHRRGKFPRPLSKQRGDENFREVITLMPVTPRTQFYPRGLAILLPVVGRLTNYVPSTLFRKRNRHLPRTIGMTAARRKCCDYGVARSVVRPLIGTASPGAG